MKFLFISLTALTIVSCTSQNETSLPEYNWNRDTYPLTDFIPLQVGNYWIYNTYMIDSSGKDSLINIDSVYISSKETQNGIEYFVLNENHGFGSDEPYSRLVRDSSGYLEYGNGAIGFSTCNFTDTLRVVVDEGVSRATYKMEREPEEITVPAGKFKCLNYKATITFDPFFNFWKHPDFYCNYYAPGVGKVKSTAFYVSKPITLERRLIRFHLAGNI
ncbi:MAG: hypothetical protein CVU05_04310 [Bacteroidetes bacterium HGW-Bacteroidetes-21]|jgi:hypothetical protein|nr:MAG: hypothetical protein CVU05_04310 [Bacteroidetes bacterium HGW-Bacteroidetes-21]